MSEIFVDTIKNKAGSTSLDSDKLPDMYSGSGRSWLSHNAGTIRDSFNHSSITDNATGNFTITITSTMANDDYVVTSTNGNSYHSYNNVTSSTQYVNYAANNSHVGYDDPQMKSIVHGDLA